ncbi:30S ribosome-binding factor RbfA [Alkalibaculum sp. M08DMB]|uniref:Ribosome-binding factor A n=1 Tax=Alkalibaculum sporogenes TaxID=2655001 RepID=A0A6A7K8V5_9FIRM|nr:30S ribosome-binding factor RbfA [Alkalibaculum sporogenes]MPW25832.1 30S ribosome-binding factor RbfA [Alkalibaculum sporogenes]
MSNRIQKINETLKQELSYLIRNLKDPRLNNDILSVIRVEATGDLRYAKVYISIFQEDGNKKQVLEILTKSSGYLRKQIGKKLTTHYTPELLFEIDSSIEYGAHIGELLKKLDKSEKEN